MKVNRINQEEFKRRAKENAQIAEKLARLALDLPPHKELVWICQHGTANKVIHTLQKISIGRGEYEAWILSYFELRDSRPYIFSFDVTKDNEVRLLMTAIEGCVDNFHSVIGEGGRLILKEEFNPTSILN